MANTIPQEQIEKTILVLRGYRVMLDSDMAWIYGVTTIRLNEQVGRNLDRFPDDFMFQLDEVEVATLRLKVTTVNTYGGRRTKPFVFTEHGALMLASILKSPVAVWSL